MRPKLSLDMTFDEVFSKYKEKYIKGTVYFEGVLMDKYKNIKKRQIVRFVTGGVYKPDYSYDRDKDHVTMSFRYKDPAKFIPIDDVLKDKDLILKIKKMNDKGYRATRIRDKYNVDENVVRDIKHGIGPFKKIVEELECQSI